MVSSDDHVFVSTNVLGTLKIFLQSSICLLFGSSSYGIFPWVFVWVVIVPLKLNDGCVWFKVFLNLIISSESKLGSSKTFWLSCLLSLHTWMGLSRFCEIKGLWHQFKSAVLGIQWLESRLQLQYKYFKYTHTLWERINLINCYSQSPHEI